jgi:YVTN family beta-propeller protein
MSVSLHAEQYKVTNRISVPGEQGWDYLFADSATRQLYVSHGDEVEIIDLDSEKPSGKISGLNRIHGIAIADDLHRGFISDGGANEVVIFDTKSNAVVQRVKTGTNPDGIVYDPPSNRVFAFNGRSQDATVIEAATGKTAGTIPLGGKPEFPVSDGKGSLYVNIEDKSEIADQYHNYAGGEALAACALRRAIRFSNRYELEEIVFGLLESEDGRR